MKRCNRCVMPDTRPGSVFEEGTCLACLNYDRRKEVDWSSRNRALLKLAEDYRDTYIKVNSTYDCVIPISGGKDSYYLVDTVVNELKLSALLIRVNDGFTMSRAGQKNLDNLVEVSGSDFISVTPSIKLLKNLTVKFFEDVGNFPFVDDLIYSIPCRIAEALGIRLVIYGENPAYEYGTSRTDSNLVDINNITNYLELGAPNPDNIFPVYMSFYRPWSGYKNYRKAQRMGFEDLEWSRHGHINGYDQIDSIGWQISNYLKFEKFGFGRVSDVVSILIREGRMTRNEAIKLVNEKDGNLDPIILGDFLKFTGYSVDDFARVCRKFRNKDIFKEKTGIDHADTSLWD